MLINFSQDKIKTFRLVEKCFIGMSPTSDNSVFTVCLFSILSMLQVCTAKIVRAKES